MTTDNVSIRPGDMADSIADWSLDRVIELLKQREREKEPQRYEYCHFSSRHGIGLLVPAIDALAVRFGCSRGRLCRWTSYHALAIARNDPVVAHITTGYVRIREAALERGDADAIAILDNNTPYAPISAESRLRSILVHDIETHSEIGVLAQMCGVPGYLFMQVFMVRSILTVDVKGMSGTASRLMEEVSRWDKWMAVRRIDIDGLIARGGYYVELDR